MSVTVDDIDKLSDAEVRQLLLELDQDEERARAMADPAEFMRHVSCLDERIGVMFKFNMDPVGPDWIDGQIVRRPEKDWGWQRGVLDLLYEKKRLIALKARQLGVTWIGCGFALWTVLSSPGKQAILYRQKEEDASKLVKRCWYQLNSLPPHLLNGASVLKPQRSKEPYLEIALGFPDGSISHILGMSSAESSGHGDTVAFALLDEYAYIQAAEAIMKAANSAVGDVGHMFIISTANGVSNELTGTGNDFHAKWQAADDTQLATVFLPWDLEPSRNEEWKATSPEYLMLTDWQKAEQYPATPEEAFTFNEANYFDKEAMFWYGKLGLAKTLFRGDFIAKNARKAWFSKRDSGLIYVYKEPEEHHRYVIGADVATGVGLDFNSAFVIDLDTMAICAEFHGKLDSDLYAYQLHYLGKWYNTARIAVEDAGGFGNPVIISLRDGREGRPPYPLYRHRQDTRADRPEHKPFGFPMNRNTRPQILENFEAVVREKLTPWLPSGLLGEMKTFVRFNPRARDKMGGVWPRALDGTNDDRVMAAAIAFELYRQRGYYPERYRPAKRPDPAPLYPWETAA